MKKNPGRHDSGRSDIGGWAFVFLYCALPLGILFLIILLPPPWGSRLTALAIFIAGMILPCMELRKTYRDKKANPHPKTIHRYQLTLIKAILCLYLSFVSSAWMFLDVPYKLFSILSMLPVPAFLALYFLFPKNFTMEQESGKTRNSLSLPLLCSSFILCFRTMMDFNFLNWPRLLILSLIPLLPLGILFPFLSKEWPVAKKTIFVFLIAMAMYVFGTLGQINAAFDRSLPVREPGILTDMHISHGSRGPNHYYLTILLDTSDTIELETDPDHYKSLTPGDKVTVYTCDGALNIPYAWAE